MGMAFSHMTRIMKKEIEWNGIHLATRSSKRPPKWLAVAFVGPKKGQQLVLLVKTVYISTFLLLS